jgi:hypothetical protein
MVLIARVPRNGILLAAMLAGAGLILALPRADTRNGCLEKEAGPKQISMRLDEEFRGTIARLEAKQRVLNKLLAGWLTFLEAVAHFRALDQLPPAFHWDHFRDLYPGNSDEERHCREVIRWLLNTADDPCLGLAHAGRYESELNALLKRGPICLPDVRLRLPTGGIAGD